MPYGISWDDDTHAIVRQVYEGRISRRDFEGMVIESCRLLDSVTHAVDVMIEWHGERSFIHDFTLISAAMFADRRVPANQRFVFIVNAPTSYRIMASILQKSAPRALGALYFVDTVEAARSLRAILLETTSSVS